MENLDTNKLKALQIQQLEKERKDLQSKTKLLVKKADHLERACRKEEIKLLDKDYQYQKKIDMAYHDAISKAKLEASKLQYEKDIDLKKRLQPMLEDCRGFKASLLGEYEQDYKTRKELAAKKLEQAKQERIKEYRKAREAEIARKLAHEKEQQLLEEQAKAEAESNCFCIFIPFLSIDNHRF